MNLTNEDKLVLCIVTLALTAIGYYPEQNNLSIWNSGQHRLYQIAVLVRDDEVIDFDCLAQQLLTLCRNQAIKPALYGVDDYPASLPNFSTIYITFYI